MDQQELKTLEARCIQEEPPWCTAACPLHVDARAFVGSIARDRWEDAWSVLRKQMPLPGILGRICDAPCEARCKRSEAGEAIRISALERACVQTQAPVRRILPLPAKGKNIAVAGSGLSSLTAAWDLVRKGYTVTVFETQGQPGAPLIQNYPQQLTAEVVVGEIALLTQLGVRLELHGDPDSEPIVAQCLDGFDAVYLGLDSISGRKWPLERDGRDQIKIDAGTQTTSRPGLFAGGQTASPVWQAAHGRWAATSIDRFLQGVSITASRDKEGPVETRLFTRLTDVAPLPATPMANAVSGYSQAEAVAEARRCLQCECMECVKVCAYLERFGAYPKRYAREIYNNLSIVMGEHTANKLINSCSLCGLCQQVCPNDFAVQDLCLQARHTMVEKAKMPPSAHEFALLDLAFSQSEQFALARHQPGWETSGAVFFPGCQLCASAPGQVEQVYAHLRSMLPDGVGLMLGCCGAPAHWAGRRQQYEEQMATIAAQWEALGKPRLILACSTCLRIFKDRLPRIQVVSLWSLLAAYPAITTVARIDRPLAIHDPCTTRYEEGLRVSVRQLLARAGQPIEELALGRENTECCGFGGLMQNANPDLAREVARRRAARSNADYITYCAMCRDNLAAAGKRVLHLLDLFFGDPNRKDPALRPRPGWSQRQENRARLRANLLENLWNEALPKMKAHQVIPLEISPELAECLERRRILVDDLQHVIHHAEASGDKLFHPPSGHYKAAYTPYKVTFWVEYTPTGKGYVVHNAYSHRMEVLGP